MFPWLMFPWLWFWAQDFHYPLSGNVAQDIEPQMIFNSIPAKAGIGRVERAAFNEVSYGTQLDAITNLLLSLAGEPNHKADRPELLRRVVKIHDRIDRAKEREYARLVHETVGRAYELKKHRPKQYQRLLNSLPPPP